MTLRNESRLSSTTAFVRFHQPDECVIWVRVEDVVYVRGHSDGTATIAIDSPRGSHAVIAVAESPAEVLDTLRQAFGWPL